MDVAVLKQTCLQDFLAQDGLPPVISVSASLRPQVEHYFRFLGIGEETDRTVVCDPILIYFLLDVLGEDAEFLLLRADEYLEPLISLHDGVEDSLLVSAFEKEKPNVNVNASITACTHPPHSVHATLALLHSSGIPFEIIVDDVPTLLLKIDALFAHLADEQDERVMPSIEIATVRLSEAIVLSIEAADNID